MTKREIFVVASKILGIYLLTRGLEFFSISFSYAITILTRGFEGTWYLLVALASLSLYMGGAFCLITWADSIAGVLAGKEEAPEVKVGVEKDSLQHIAFSAVGVFMVATALPRLSDMVATLTVQVSHQARLRTWGAIVGIVLQLGIGTFLFFGSRGLVGLIKKIKAI